MIHDVMQWRNIILVGNLQHFSNKSVFYHTLSHITVGYMAGDLYAGGGRKRLSFWIQTAMESLTSPCKCWNYYTFPWEISVHQSCLFSPAHTYKHLSLPGYQLYSHDLQTSGSSTFSFFALLDCDQLSLFGWFSSSWQTQYWPLWYSQWPLWVQSHKHYNSKHWDLPLGHPLSYRLILPAPVMC